MRKVKVIHSDNFLDRWSKLSGFKVNGLALFEVIIIRKDVRHYYKSLNHEQIHIAQQREMLYLPFLLFYVGHYLILRVKGLSHKQAYRGIFLEKEAYANEGKITYVYRRKCFASFRYINKINK